jgi:hypothetical protein
MAGDEGYISKQYLSRVRLREMAMFCFLMLVLLASAISWGAMPVWFEQAPEGGM